MEPLSRQLKRVLLIGVIMFPMQLGAQQAEEALGWTGDTARFLAPILVGLVAAAVAVALMPFRKQAPLP